MKLLLQEFNVAACCSFSRLFELALQIGVERDQLVYTGLELDIFEFVEFELFFKDFLALQAAAVDRLYLLRLSHMHQL